MISMKTFLINDSSIMYSDNILRFRRDQTEQYNEKTSLLF
jgi:hypothetical protein